MHSDATILTRVRIWAKALGVALVGLLALGVAGAGADTSATVRIVGTSDVNESGLFQNVIEPRFEAAFPQYELSYTPSSESAAASNAEAGTGGPSVLLLHNQALESKFVAGGYSYENQYGSALFYSDYVLAGTTGDVADVAANGGHDIARAFADVAAAGVTGGTTFLSRGGTITAPASTIEEHAIWKLVFDSGLTPAGVTLCSVSEADGGGMAPVTSAAQPTPGGPCPESGTVNSATDAPSWYHLSAGLNQSANVIAANNCTVPVNGSTNCYALTDRGTFNYLMSGNDPAGTISNLAVLSADQSPTAPGGASELLTHFHAYMINPAKSGETVNLQGARDLVGFLASPFGQGQIGSYLASAGKSPGAPFKPDAAPAVTAAPSTTSVRAGSPVTVTGSVSDPEPGYPGLAGQPVIVRGPGGGQLASGLIDAHGGYSVAFTPPASGSYEVAVPAISRLVEPAAVPPFGDLLAPTASAPFALTVTAAEGPRTSAEGVRVTRVTVRKGLVTVTGALDSPAGQGAGVALLVARAGKLAQPGKHRGARTAAAGKKKAKQIAKTALAAGATKFTIKHRLPRGFRYALQVSYAAPGQSTVTSKPKRVAVP